MESNVWCGPTAAWKADGPTGYSSTLLLSTVSIFRARTLVRISKIDAKGILAVLPGWNWRKTIRLNGHPKKVNLYLTEDKEVMFYAYANVNLKAERAKDLDPIWCD